MSAEGAVSVGAPGGGVVVAAAGPAVAGAGSMSAEVGTSGAGFDNGLATFSGLGRSDFSSGQFSVNEGPKGPVSFTNSIDLFAETKPITSPTFSVPEGPVRGDIFGQTEIIAKAPVATSAAEQETNNPLAVLSLGRDIRSATEALNILDDVDADPKTIARISNYIVNTVVEKNELIETIEQKVQSSEEARTEAETVDQTKNNEQTEVAYADVEIDEEIETDETPPVPQDNKDQGIVRHEEANEARVEHRNEALRQAAQEDVDPVTGKLKGKAILERVNTHDNEQSDLAQSAGVEDGSIPEADRLIARSEFKSIEEAEKVIFNAVKENTGVKRGTAGQGATQEEVRKVLKGKPTANTIEQSLPKAA